MDNFRGYPKTISEERANRGSRGDLWTPRDALISVLRDIDEGVIAPTSVIVCCATAGVDKDGVDFVKTNEYIATPGRMYTLGMLHSAIQDIQ